MNEIFSVFEVNSYMSESLVGYFSTFEKAEQAAIEVALDESMERYGPNIWLNPESWGTVYIKTSPVDVAE